MMCRADQSGIWTLLYMHVYTPLFVCVCSTNVFVNKDWYNYNTFPSAAAGRAYTQRAAFDDIAARSKVKGERPSLIQGGPKK